MSYYDPAPRVRGIERWCASDVCLSRTSGLSLEQTPRKTKIDTELAHVTLTPLSRSKVNLHGGGAYCGDLMYSLRRLRFSSDADIVRLTNACIIIIIINHGQLWYSGTINDTHKWYINIYICGDRRICLRGRAGMGTNTLWGGEGTSVPMQLST